MAYEANEIIAAQLLIDRQRYPAQMASSKAQALEAPTADTICVIKKNGVQIALLTFPAGDPVGVFSGMAAAEKCASGDYLTVEAPAVPDATFNNALISLFSERYIQDP